MTIDEVILIEKYYGKKDEKALEELQKEFPMIEGIAENNLHEQIAKWLEELKAIKSDGFTDHLLNTGYTKGYRNGIDEFAEALKDICKNHPISNDGHTPLYIHEDGTYHELIEDAMKQMKGGAE